MFNVFNGQPTHFSWLTHQKMPGHRCAGPIVQRRCHGPGHGMLHRGGHSHLGKDVVTCICKCVYIYILFIYILYIYIYIYIRRPRPWPRQGRRLGPPQVWNFSFLAFQGCLPALKSHRLNIPLACSTPSQQAPQGHTSMAS